MKLQRILFASWLLAFAVQAESLRVAGYDQSALTPEASLKIEEQRRKGHNIAQLANDYEPSLGSSYSRATMTLRDRLGNENIRVLRVRTLESKEGIDKSIAIFDEPKDVAGTALLTHAHLERDDDQWLYLPALKRVKRIASRNKTGPFMGSEFAYEDLGSQNIRKFDYRYLKEAELDGLPCYVLERKPRDRYSGYSKQHVWLVKSDYRVLKVEYFDRKFSLMKTLTLSDWKQHQEKVWRPDRVLMTNHQSGNSTEVYWSDYQFNVGYKDRDFDKSALSRTR